LSWESASDSTTPVFYSGAALAPSASHEAHMDITRRSHLRTFFGIRNPEDIRMVTSLFTHRLGPLPSPWSSLLCVGVSCSTYFAWHRRIQLICSFAITL
jgi:hypothetical protein